MRAFAILATFTNDPHRPVFLYPCTKMLLCVRVRVYCAGENWYTLSFVWHNANIDILAPGRDVFILFFLIPHPMPLVQPFNHTSEIHRSHVFARRERTIKYYKNSIFYMFLSKRFEFDCK